jgi:PHD/YefM family antitoxin component YafN of YafNO toxin-antitoxin module
MAIIQNSAEKLKELCLRTNNKQRPLRISRSNTSQFPYLAVLIPKNKGIPP